MRWSTSLRLAAFNLLPRAWMPAVYYNYYRARGVLEPELDYVMARVKPGMRAIDVGANEGVYTHAFAKAGAIVEAFEPQRACLAALNGYSRQRHNVHVHPVALGAAAGSADLFVPVVRGRLVSGHASLNASGGEAVRYAVPVRTLDSFGFDRVAVIKIDVEGHEADVLAGARVTIAANRPMLLVEIEARHLSGSVTDVFRAMTDMGYSGSFLHPAKGEQPLSAFNAEEHQNATNADRPGGVYVNNFIFVPRS